MIGISITRRSVAEYFCILFISLLCTIPTVVLLSARADAAGTNPVFNCGNLNGTNATKCNACVGSGGIHYDAYTGKCTNDTGNVDEAEDTVTSLIADALNIFSFIVGVASVLMIMIGGFKYVTSQGDSNNITSAKNTILYAIIGLVVVAFAQVIVQFVIGKI